MAINFQLLDKVTNEPQSLNEVDEIICKEYLDVEINEGFYGGDPKSEKSFDWFNTIGFMLASGKTLEDGENSIRKHYQNSEIWKEELPIIEKIINFLQERYTTEHWVSVGK